MSQVERVDCVGIVGSYRQKTLRIFRMNDIFISRGPPTFRIHKVFLQTLATGDSMT